MEYEYVNSILECNFLDLTIELDKPSQGKYIVMVEAEFPGEESGEITLSTYSKSTMYTSKIENPDRNFLHKVFRNHVSRIDTLVPVVNRIKISETQNDWIVFQLLFKEGGFGYIDVGIAGNSEEKIEVRCNLR
jgi:hypothetical protein